MVLQRLNIYTVGGFMKKYYSYVYLDSTVIDDLYPQVFGDDAIGTEILKTREEGINADIRPKNMCK